jgi:hypothetical protein
MANSGKLIAKSALAVFFCAIALHAQVSNGVEFKAPFSFYIGKVLMPAGTYFVKQTQSESFGSITVSSADSSHTTTIIVNQTESLNPPQSSSVSFEQFGDRLFFDQVHVAGETYGVAAIPTKNERQAEQMASLDSRRSLSVAGQ